MENVGVIQEEWIVADGISMPADPHPIVIKRILAHNDNLFMEWLWGALHEPFLYLIKWKKLLNQYGYQ
jgi:hypothetical protein